MNWVLGVVATVVAGTWVGWPYFNFNLTSTVRFGVIACL